MKSGFKWCSLNRVSYNVIINSKTRFLFNNRSTSLIPFGKIKTFLPLEVHNGKAFQQIKIPLYTGDNFFFHKTLHVGNFSFPKKQCIFKIKARKKKNKK